MKYLAEYHSFDSQEGVQRYLNKRSTAGWELHSIVPTGRLKDGIRPILMYIWRNHA